MIRSLATVAVAAVGLSLLSTGTAAADPRPLHTTHGRQAAIVDDRGAEVLLRGVNVNQLAEYYQANPDLPPTVPLRKSDFRQIAALGFNSVRLLVSWSRLQPTPGSYDTAYVAQVRRAVRWAARQDLYVVLDMHQDAYGVAVGTPDGTTCPFGSHPSNGWDGAPAWATITDGATTCGSGAREVAPAVKAAWQNFYADTAGVQTQLVRTWGRLARDFARSSTVAGFDLLNEPGLSTTGTDDTADLGRFYRRAIAAIRAGERAGKGFSHLVFFEPSVLWSALGSWETPDRGFTRDHSIVFAPHIYAESLSDNSIESGFQSAADTAAEYGVPFWSGEWGFFADEPSDAADEVRRYARAEDAAGVGGAWWSWKQACGDPHVVPSPGAAPNPLSPSLVRYSCPDQQASSVARAFGDVLSRPVPRAVPGRTTKLVSDGRTGRFELRGVHTRGADRCALRIFVPRRFADTRVRVDGVDRVRTTRHLGNMVLRGCVDDTFRVRLG